MQKPFAQKWIKRSIPINFYYHIPRATVRFGIVLVMVLVDCVVELITRTYINWWWWSSIIIIIPVPYTYALEAQLHAQSVTNAFV